MANNKFLLNDDEMVFFIDYNNTLVDYENEFDIGYRGSFDGVVQNSVISRVYLLETLQKFEAATGIKPRICIVTNAHRDSIDVNGFPGIFNDVKMTFFNTGKKMTDGFERYIKYLVYRENDGFFTINPGRGELFDLFDFHEFGDEAKSIRLVEDFKKLETVKRMMTILDPEAGTKNGISKHILFAGDSIRDDYPMMRFETEEGISKVFVRPRKVQRMSANMMWKFYTAAGGTLSSIHPKTNKPFSFVDDGNFSLLSETDRRLIEGYAFGGRVFLTQKNSRGLMDGIRSLQEIIVSSGMRPKQKNEEW